MQVYYIMVILVAFVSFFINNRQRLTKFSLLSFVVLQFINLNRLKEALPSIIENLKQFWIPVNINDIFDIHINNFKLF
jgi:hypothetical protein